MTDKQLINKIKELKKVKPDQKWLNLTRQDLIHQISTETDDGLRFGSLFDWLWFHRLQPIALSLMLMLVVTGGPWLTVKAAQSSLPGEFLYSVKKIAEKVQLTLTSDKNKAGIQVDFAYKRMEELNKITANSSSAEEKMTKVKEVVSDFKVSLTDAGANMDKADKNKVAQMVSKAKKIEKDLSQTSEEDEGLAGELAQAKEAIENINQLMATLISDDSDAVATSSEDIIGKDIVGEADQDEVDGSDAVADEMNTETTTPKLIIEENKTTK